MTTSAATARPPFRADHVGSLLRPAALKTARERFAAGTIEASVLRAAEDEAIAAMIRRQEAIGLAVATDGELRRSWWHYDFFWNMEGIEKVSIEGGIQFAGVQTKAEAPRVMRRIGFGAHPFLDHFRYLAKTTRVTPKITIPGPSMLHWRGGRKMIDMTAYRDMETFYEDLGGAYAQAIRAFHDAGCRYLQLDDISFAYLCDPVQKESLRSRGDDPDRQAEIYASLVRRALREKPADMTVTMHLCRGNFRSTFVASGGYEPLADLIFNAMPVDGYFMEWDTDRAGGFEPLRFLPAGKRVVLGLVSSKTGALESADDLMRRIDEAATFTPLDRLCISPQCGFASTEEGNVLAEDEQWRKLERVVEVARRVWGSPA